MQRILNVVGLSLLAACYAVAAFRVFTRESEQLTGRGTTLRVAHWQLEAGVTTALDEVARRYEELHPGVRVEQMLIPERVFPSWVTTQLVGGTAPDIVQLGKGSNSEERLARYFLPLTPFMQEPNPYNAGTPLADVPWRDTFIDGLSTHPNYNASLLEVYGVSISVVTTRVFYNRELFEQITGHTNPPATFQEFTDLLAAVRDSSKRTGKGVVAIAGSRFNAPQLADRLFGVSLQKRWLDTLAETELRSSPERNRLALLQGDLPLDDPAIHLGLELVREVGSAMQPGFEQLNREDATFLFAQGKALMIVSGSYDFTSLRQQTTFPVGVFRVPSPDPRDPRFADFVLGEMSEADTATSGSLGITSASRQPDRAVDFLRFLTSFRSSSEFTRVSGWLPSVVQVPVADEVLPMAPVIDGFPPTLNLTLGPDTGRVVSTSTHLLYGELGSARKFLEGIRTPYASALRSELQRGLKVSLANIQRQDTPVAALWKLSRDGSANAASKWSELIEIQNASELTHYRIERELTRAAAQPPSN